MINKKIIISIIIVSISFTCLSQIKNNVNRIIYLYKAVEDLNNVDEDIYVPIVNVLSDKEYKKERNGIFSVRSFVTHTYIYIVIIENNKIDFLENTDKEYVIAKINNYCSRNNISLKNREKYVKKYLEIAEYNESMSTSIENSGLEEFKEYRIDSLFH